MILPGIQSATIKSGEPLDSSPITLDFLESEMDEDEFAALTRLIPLLKKRSAWKRGSPNPPRAGDPGAREPVPPSQSSADESSSSLSPADAKADPQPDRQRWDLHDYRALREH